MERFSSAFAAGGPEWGAGWGERHWERGCLPSGWPPLARGSARVAPPSPPTSAVLLGKAQDGGHRGVTISPPEQVFDGTCGRVAEWREMVAIASHRSAAGAATF